MLSPNWAGRNTQPFVRAVFAGLGISDGGASRKGAADNRSPGHNRSLGGTRCDHCTGGPHADTTRGQDDFFRRDAGAKGKGGDGKKSKTLHLKYLPDNG